MMWWWEKLRTRIPVCSTRLTEARTTNGRGSKDLAKRTTTALSRSRTESLRHAMSILLGLPLGAALLTGCSHSSSISTAQRDRIETQYIKDINSGTDLKMGAIAKIPHWFDSIYLLKDSIKKGYRVKSVQVFGIVTTDVTYQSGELDGPAYEADVDLQVCAGHRGFPTNSSGFPNAGDISSQIWLIPNGISAFSSTDSPTLITNEPQILNTPSLGPDQCFRGVQAYAVPESTYNFFHRRFLPTETIKRGGRVALTAAQGPFQSGLSLSWVWRS